MQMKKRKDKMKDILIEDNIPLPKRNLQQKKDAQYRDKCKKTMLEMEVGQSFLVYDRVEGCVREWIGNIHFMSDSDFKWNREFYPPPYYINIGDEEIDVTSKDLRYKTQTIKSEKKTISYRYGKKIERYPVRVWRIK